jgi:hypothetical protein
VAWRAVTSEVASTAEPPDFSLSWNVLAALEMTKYGLPTTRPVPPVRAIKTTRFPFESP